MKANSVRCNRLTLAVFQSGFLTLGLSASLISLRCRMAHAQVSLSSTAIVGANNDGGFIATIDRHDVADNTTVSANATRSFTGKDRAGNNRTMTFTGKTVARSDYGSLHCLTSASLTNSYYNAANPAFANTNGQIIDPNGSPNSLTTLGFAIFNDTLQYGGALQAGYKARYIFHVDGTNSGTGTLADLGVTVDTNPSNSFFAFDPGAFAADWVTSDFAVNGVTPQHINVQFSDQVVFDTVNLADGQNYAGTSDFSSTLTLSGIEVVDANGRPATGWTVTSCSGTRYPLFSAPSTPEPGVTALLLSLGIPAGMLALRRRNA